MTRRRVAIIGAGFSGASVAAQLLRARGRNQVVLIERGARFGTGLAYGVDEPTFVLNVRSANMSALPDAPDDFVRWLKPKTDIGAGDIFAPRRQYGRYVEHMLGRAERAGFGRLKRVRGDAIACRAEGDGWRVSFERAKPIDADAVVLALGNALADAPAPLSGITVLGAFDADARRRIPRRADVLLVGTGLTAVDVALALDAQGHTGTIYALSRRGLLPRTQTTASKQPHFGAAEFPAELSDALHVFRRKIAVLAERGEPWQWAFERVRLATPELWQRLSPAQQQRFLRHLRPWWDTHRHRAAPQVGARIDELIKQGRLRVLAGEIVNATPLARGVQIMHRQRGSFVRHRMEAGVVINCAGAAFDIARSADPLVMQLRAEGLVRAHPTGLGFDVDSDGALIGAGGQAHPSLFTLGPPTQGAFWESTAVPEIRMRAQRLSQMLTGEG
ncbi:MAG: FAD/NAD(P)-binding protein [Terricaulis sp.]